MQAEKHVIRGNDRPIVANAIDNYLDLTANWIYHQMRHLRHHRPIVLCNTRSNSNNFPVDDVFSVSDLGSIKRFTNRFERRVTLRTFYRYHYEILSAYNPTLLHSHFGPRAFCDLELTKAINIPLVASFYGVDATKLPQQDSRWLGRYHELFSHANLFVVEAPNMKKILVELGCDSSKVVVNSFGVDLSKIIFKPRSCKDVLRIFIASTFREKKGIPDALEAIGKIKDKLSPFSITIAGGRVDLLESVEEEAKILQVISKYNLTDKVEFLGFLSHGELLAECLKHDIFISTSKTARSGDTEGGTNIVLLEMAASGMPIITTNHCDLPSTMGEFNQRWVAEEGNIDSIATAIEGIVTDDWELLGRSNREHIENKFDINRCVENLEQIYVTVAGTGFTQSQEVLNVRR